MTTRTHRRAANTALAVVAALMVLAAHKTLDGLTAPSLGFIAALSGPTGTILALLMLYPAEKVGEVRRGVEHGRGIIRSHLHAIKGKGLALVLLGAAAFVMVGGAR